MAEKDDGPQVVDQRTARAARHARSHHRRPRHPPHWLRCEHVDEATDRRCELGDGHDGAHVLPKEE